VPVSSLVSLAKAFSLFAATDDRVKDAKKFGETAEKLTACRISNDLEQLQQPLRAFNLVIFEKHLDEIRRAFGLDS